VDDALGCISDASHPYCGVMRNCGLSSQWRRSSFQAIPVPHWKVRKTMSIIRFRDAALTPSAQQFLYLLRTRWAGDEMR
jgi:hypothetical protein